MNITRKQFCEGLGAGTVLLLIQACGGSGGSGNAGFNAGTCNATAISLNHGHVLEIPLADIDLTTPKTYSIAGTAGHDHTVTLSPANFATLKSGQSVAGLVSTSTTTVANGPHTHTITMMC